MDQNLITRGDLPRFVMDSYEECRGPPRLFLLDKYDFLKQAYWGCVRLRNAYPTYWMNSILIYIVLTGLMLRVLEPVWSATLIHHSLKWSHHPLEWQKQKFIGKRKPAKLRSLSLSLSGDCRGCTIFCYVVIINSVHSSFWVLTLIPNQSGKRLPHPKDLICYIYAVTYNWSEDLVSSHWRGGKL